MNTRLWLFAALAVCLAITDGCSSGKRGPTSRRAMTFQQRKESQAEFKQKLLTNYDLSNPHLDIDDLFTPGVDIDVIASLDNPAKVMAANAEYPDAGSRVIEVVINGEAVAYPLGIMSVHEVANDTVGDIPVAITYCPLCDSASVFDRHLPSNDGKMSVTEFGVSGMLYQSNLTMYDRTTMSLWSQADMKALTGPFAGNGLRHLPVRVVSFKQFKAAHPDGKVLSTETGHDESYTEEEGSLAEYLSSDWLYMPVEFGDALPRKTLGMGIRAGDYAAFVTKDAAATYPVAIETPRGLVIVGSNEAGMYVESAPDEVKVMQALYFAWSAFHPETLIITASAQENLLDGNAKSFVIVGYSTSYAWPEMLQEMLDEHSQGDRIYHVLNAVIGGAAVELWVGGQGQQRKDKTIGAMVRDYFGKDARMRGQAPQPTIALCQQSLQFTRTQRGPIADGNDAEGVRIGADTFEKLAYILHDLGIGRVYIGTHIYKQPIEPEVGNERLALAELLRRQHPYIFAGPDVWTPTRDAFSSAYSDDGLHPNEYGMKIMAEGWYRAIAGPDARQEIIDRMYARQYDTDTMMRAYINSRSE